MKKAIIFIVAMVLAVGVGIGATLAYLSVATNPVVNTFAYGDINIDLWENDYIRSSNSLDTNTKVTAESDYKMIPGNTMPKNPTVTVKANSEACWLFIKIEETANFDDFMTYGVATGWTPLDGVSGVYWREVDATTEDVNFGVLADDKVSVKSDVLKTELTGLTQENYPKLTFTAYAVQQANVDDASTAWAIAQNGGNLPANP